MQSSITSASSSFMLHGRNRGYVTFYSSMLLRYVGHRFCIPHQSLFKYVTSQTLHGSKNDKNLLPSRIKNCLGSANRTHWQPLGYTFSVITRLFCFIQGNLATELMRSGRLSERAAISLVVKPYLSVLGYLHGQVITTRVFWISVIITFRDLSLFPKLLCDDCVDQQGIIHRDLKPENMVIGRTASSRIVKLADFGLSIDTSKYDAMARTGTLDYMAPEVVTCPRLHSPESCSSGGRCVYGCAVDVWSLGVVVYELLVGAPPFEEQDPESTVEAILTREPDFPPNMSEGMQLFAGNLNRGDTIALKHNQMP